MSRDPLGLWGDESQRGNGQSYCGNNPVNYIDPFGRESVRVRIPGTDTYRTLDEDADWQVLKIIRRLQMIIREAEANFWELTEAGEIEEGAWNYLPRGDRLCSGDNYLKEERLLMLRKALIMAYIQAGYSAGWEIIGQTAGWAIGRLLVRIVDKWIAAKAGGGSGTLGTGAAEAEGAGVGQTRVRTPTPPPPEAPAPKPLPDPLDAQNLTRLERAHGFRTGRLSSGDVARPLSEGGLQVGEGNPVGQYVYTLTRNGDEVTVTVTRTSLGGQTPGPVSTTSRPASDFPYLSDGETFSHPLAQH